MGSNPITYSTKLRNLSQEFDIITKILHAASGSFIVSREAVTTQEMITYAVRRDMERPIESVLRERRNAIRAQIKEIVNDE